MNPIVTYLNKLPEGQRKVLKKLYADIKAIVPGAEEYISTGVPAFKYNGKYLVSFGASKKHMSLFVMQGDALKEVKNELEGYNAGNKVIRFTAREPIEPSLLKKIIQIRIKEIKA